MISKKTLLIAAVIIALIVLYTTTVYIPKGYTVVTGKALYPEGIHLFQKYPFEDIKMVKLAECAKYNASAYLNDAYGVDVNVGVCWEIVPDVNKINDLNALYSHGRDNVDYKELLIYPSMMSNTKEVFRGFNVSTLDPYNLNVSGGILDRMQHDLAYKGIVVRDVTVSLPSFEALKEVIKEKKSSEDKRYFSFFLSAASID